MALATWLAWLRWTADPVALAAGVTAVAALVVACAPRVALARLGAALPRAGWVTALALLAASLSAGYVVHYLRGGPRIIDATSYWLEARTFAAGAATFAPPGPLASFAGRFLERPADSGELAVIFPPGYPAVLALGFLAGVPLAVGPLIAAALVVVTYALGRITTGRDDAALLAAALSALSAVLRYHTADTMSHGWAALLGALTLLGALHGTPRAAVGSGLAAGWLLATRPVSAPVFAALAIALLAARPRRLLPFFLACLPGAGLLFWHQHAATGDFFVSSQARYYSLADGPPGCFRYGLGAAIGCRFEHGDFVATVLPRGFDLWAALRVTHTRLFVHLGDAANLPLLAPLILVGAFGARERRALVWPALGVVGIVLAYLPFYFDGSYPGGGARLYVDALPLEHVLMAQGFVALRAVRAAAPLALGGFAAVTSGEHRALAARDGGAPLFEPRVLAAAGVTNGLVLLDTDHGFSLGHDPRIRDATRGVVVARRRDDANDRLLWLALGRPATRCYAAGNAFSPPSLVACVPVAAEVWRYEAESNWPLDGIAGGWAHPDFSACASGGRVLRLRSTGPEAVRARFGLAVPEGGRYQLETRWAALDRVDGDIGFGLHGRGGAQRAARAPGTCWSAHLGTVELPAGEVVAEVWASGEGAALDAVLLTAQP